MATDRASGPHGADEYGYSDVDEDGAGPNVHVSPRGGVLQPRYDRRYGSPRAAADRTASYEDNLVEYRRLAEEYFDADRYADFCAFRLPHVEEMVYNWVGSPEFDALLVREPHLILLRALRASLR